MPERCGVCGKDERHKSVATVRGRRSELCGSCGSKWENAKPLPPQPPRCPNCTRFLHCVEQGGGRFLCEICDVTFSPNGEVKREEGSLLEIIKGMADNG